MENTAAIADLAGIGATYVLYLLVALSAAQLAVMIERGVVFWRTRAPLRRLRARLARAGESGDLGALGRLEKGRSLEERVLAAAAGRAGDGPGAAEKIAESRLTREKLALEKRLSFLGTLGNNVPFLGLFGTVLGIIHAFADLSADPSSRTAVMAGISEALVLTGVGLLVALPAVAAFNFFQRVIKSRSGQAESLVGELVSLLHAGGDRAPALADRARQAA